MSNEELTSCRHGISYDPDYPWECRWCFRDEFGDFLGRIRVDDE